MSAEEATDRRLRAVESSMDRLNGTVTKIGEAIDKLVLIEERSLETKRTLERAFETLKDHETRIRQYEEITSIMRDNRKLIDDHEERMREVEEQMPLLTETRKWVVMGVVSGLGMMLAGLVKLLWK